MTNNRRDHLLDGELDQLEVEVAGKVAGYAAQPGHWISKRPNTEER